MDTNKALLAGTGIIAGTILGVTAITTFGPQSPQE